MDRPAPVQNPDFTELLQACKDYLDFVASEDFSTDGADDYENNIFEKALLAVFGPNTFEYLNERVEQIEG